MRYFLLLLLATIVACGNKEKSTNTTTEKTTVVYENEYLVKVGDTAPDFTLPLAGGGTFTLSQERGKVVMLQFTASWCGVCRREMPHIEKQIWQRHKNNPNFALVGVDREESASTVKKYTAQVGTTYPIALDTAANVFASYALRNSGITRNVLIGKDGRIVKLTRLFNEKEFNSLVSAIDSLLAE